MNALLRGRLKAVEDSKGIMNGIAILSMEDSGWHLSCQRYKRASGVMRTIEKDFPTEEEAKLHLSGTNVALIIIDI